MPWEAPPAARRDSCSGCITSVKSTGRRSRRDAYSLLRGMKTSGAAHARQNESAMTIAQWLSRHPAVEQVNYPGLAAHPNHDIAARQMRGFGGMLSFSVRGVSMPSRSSCPSSSSRTVQRISGASRPWCGPPSVTSHVECSAEERAAAGIPEGLVRYSTGIEDVADLIADLDQALAHLR